MESIDRGWTVLRGGRNVGIVDTIHNCRHEISVWRKDNPPYGKDKIDTLQKALEEVQNDFSKSHEEVLEVIQKLKRHIRMKNYIGNRKVKPCGICGDRNTKFYHALTKQRRIQNRIICLYNEDGNWTNSEDEIEGVAVKYFNDCSNQPFRQSLVVFYRKFQNLSRKIRT